MKDKLMKKRYLLPGEKEVDMYARAANAVMGSRAKEYSELMSNGIFLPNSPTLANAGTNKGGLSACYVIPIEDSLIGIYEAVTTAALVHRAFGGTGFDFTPIRAKGEYVNSTGGDACGPVKVLRLLNQSAETVSQGGKREGANMGILNVNHLDIVEFTHAKAKDDTITHFNTSIAVTDHFMETDNGFLREIAECAWKCGSPGLIFIDEINRHNPTPQLGDMTATNPCGEQPLLPNESCNLGSINLGKFVHQNDFNLDYFGGIVEDGIEFLDSVININKFPTAEIEAATLQTRKLGEGIMGWADSLILMGIHYGSQDALNQIDVIGKELQSRSREASMRLAEEFGTFPAYEGSIWSVRNMKLRNATLTTIAPTGTLSYLAKCSSGIEPIFAWKHTRESEEGIETMVNPLYDIAVSNGLEEDTAYGIHWMWQIEHQARWQRWIDNAVSKTINLPENATVEDIEAIYTMAWEKKCKGITVYRKGSRDKEVLVESKMSQRKKVIPAGITIRSANVYEAQSGCGTIRGIIDRENGKPFETFVLTGGGCGANNECAGRLISDEMQDGRPPWKISNTLHKVKCANAMKNPHSVGNSCSDLLGTFIDIETAEDDLTTPHTNTPKCPECGTELIFEGGCGTGSCAVCGWSGCS